ncbi:hypothetical protein DKX38_012430 [Salix brachista]|uniref:Guanylyl cyclase n=1 Tax=Salix brachista TaxID=2182728 RepID=A0A5N5LNX6_9ROSI|nr:hypothetical protein DKX38_012430 [Salix brachista]
MWPLYLLLNKILNIQDLVVEEGKPDGLVQPSSSSSSRKCEDASAVLPCSHFVQVPHIKQLHSWDCGLACVLMALNAIGINNCSIQGLADLCCTSSIWTVDLAYLLQKYSVSFSFFTVTLGANPNYSVETFYKEQLPTDLVRVDMLFQKARGEGISIQCRSINEREISLFILSGKYIAIALVNQYKLSHSWLEDAILPGLNGDTSGYAGHYIVICGYDAGTDEFEIRDPATSRPLPSEGHQNGILKEGNLKIVLSVALLFCTLKHERMSSRCLEEARKSFGTDEDLLLVSVENATSERSH